jgi:hypothetical protein
MLNINEEVIHRIKDDIEGLLRDYNKDLNEAFLKAEDALTIAFKSKISPDGVYLEVETSIEFTMEKIKGKTRHTVGGLQTELTFDPAKIQDERVIDPFPHRCSTLDKDGNCTTLSLCSFICMDRCINSERAKMPF